ncbi:hypothetical protein [uncultured Enterovirga sp.]|uniref:hypothetical protein n=1 Tax=uncultured Enterovirga sp. TaxID=2026352 RepID=UPI0035C9B322
MPGDWTEIAVRCEAATGPSCDLDIAIIEAVIPKIKGAFQARNKDGTFVIDPPPYTASCDAILALITDTLPEADIRRVVGDALQVIWRWLTKGAAFTAAFPLALCFVLCERMAARASEPARPSQEDGHHG